MAFALSSRVAAARPAARVAPRPAAPRRAPVAARAGLRMYPEPEFVEETLSAFPEKMIADAEEARVR